MKPSKFALVTAFAIAPTLALAQSGGASGGTEVPNKPGIAAQRSHNDAKTTGEARGAGRSTGSNVTTGSGVPQDKPNLSNSPESSDMSQRAK